MNDWMRMRRRETYEQGFLYAAFGTGEDMSSRREAVEGRT